MLLQRLKQLNKQQGGFTLIELIVSIVLVSLISIAVAITMVMIFKVSASSSDRVTAARQVQNAGMWITEDGQSAQTITIGGSHFLEVSWRDWDTTLYDVKYDIANGQLTRTYSINGGNPSVIVIAQYIDTSGNPAKTRVAQSGDTYILTVTATLTGFTANGQPVSETRTYEFLPRPGS